MIRTKSYITREITKLLKREKKLKEELELLNKMGHQVAYTPFNDTKKVIKRELLLIEGKLLFATWCADTSEKSLPKIKKKKKKTKSKKTVNAE